MYIVDFILPREQGSSHLTGKPRFNVPQQGLAALKKSRAFLRNPEKYPDPENFRPERWLQPGWPTYQEPLTVYPTIKGMTSFGWGQRQCLGQAITQDELIVACGALSWCFNLRHKKDPVTGCDLPVPLDRSNSLLIIKPNPFQMEFEPRSQERKEEALRLWAESDSKDKRERAEFLEARQKESQQSAFGQKFGQKSMAPKEVTIDAYVQAHSVISVKKILVGA